MNLRLSPPAWRRPERGACDEPVLRFSPTAWAKLMYLRDLGPTEIGAFGVADPEDLLGVQDVVLVGQEATAASVAFDDAAVADFFDAQVELGRRPEQFARLWIHTHPGDSPSPSGTDRATFARVFGDCEWAVMFILARSGRSFARMRFNVGPGGQVQIPVEVDCACPFGPSDHEGWQSQYRQCVRTCRSHGARQVLVDDGPSGIDEEEMLVPEDWLEELELMDPAERRLVLSELSARPDLWGEPEEEVDLVLD